MIQRRDEQDTDDLSRTTEMMAYESTRSASEPAPEKGAEPKKEEEQISLFWRVFGGTILSIVALVSITLFNNMSSSITELRTALSNEREARAELVKKDEFNTRVTAQYERMRAIDTVKVELEGLKEKISTNTAAVDGVKRDTNATIESIKKDAATSADAMKKDATALEILKERVVLLEGVKKDIASLDTIKEKMVATAADLKSMRDDLQKLAGEVDRNKNSDLERKALRDSQHKQVDESLKELQKGLQDCREKLARLEGAQPKPSADVPVPFSRPVEPSKPKPSGTASPAKPSEIKPAGGTSDPGSSKSGPEGE
ncbi:hypothetical protein VT84_19565 [Gemmata sp. SH-PL17]|uniref:hypothetical protein n=1 Tax=Gemmata sp. SH-PL17 TaxID=1630693 RepID=UPI00078CDCF9|nr:hypothetical protein [Gemmata sp. SH-PL17]AMV26606.1 hypothetical protein VT84_19565 [Gemmata sp. SH-PL17]